MQKKGLQFLWAFIFLLSFNNVAICSEEPAELKVGIYVKSLTINNKNETAVIDFYYWYRMFIPKDSTDLKMYYQLEVTNGDLMFNEIHEEKIIGNCIYISGRIKGDFRFDANYVNYPFDKQKLLIQFEHPMFTRDKIKIVPDYYSYIKCQTNKKFWGLSDGLVSDGLTPFRSQFVSGYRTYNTDFGDPSISSKNSSYSNLSYYIYITRDAAPYTIKFMLPLIIILCLAYMVFYIPADALDLACGLTVTSLLAGIAFQWTLSDDLPNVGYLTCVDKIFYLSYILIMLSMAQTLLTYHLEKDGNMKLSNVLEIGGRWLFPIAFFGGCLFFILSAR